MTSSFLDSRYSDLTQACSKSMKTFQHHMQTNSEKKKKSKKSFEYHSNKPNAIILTKIESVIGGVAFLSRYTIGRKLIRHTLLASSM